MKALILNCTLKSSPETSNTEALARVLIAEWKKAKVESEILRLADLNIKPGVKTDMGGGDGWPQVHAKLKQCEILVIATPTWMGQMSSIAKCALERLDAVLGETDDKGRPWTFGKVAGIVITGNEDGAHHIVGTVSQSLIDVGYTVPAWSWTYWHLGPGPGPDYNDTQKSHDYSDRVGRNAARNLVWAAKALAAVQAPEQEVKA